MERRRRRSHMACMPKNWTRLIPMWLMMFTGARMSLGKIRSLPAFTQAQVGGAWGRFLLSSPASTRHQITVTIARREHTNSAFHKYTLIKNGIYGQPLLSKSCQLQMHFCKVRSQKTQINALCCDPKRSKNGQISVLLTNRA